MWTYFWRKKVHEWVRKILRSQTVFATVLYYKHGRITIQQFNSNVVNKRLATQAKHGPRWVYCAKATLWQRSKKRQADAIEKRAGRHLRWAKCLSYKVSHFVHFFANVLQCSATPTCLCYSKMTPLQKTMWKRERLLWPISKLITLSEN